MAIPYHGGAAAVESRFSNDFEALSYGIQSHLEEPQVLPLLKKEWRQLREIMSSQKNRQYVNRTFAFLVPGASTKLLEREDENSDKLKELANSIAKDYRRHLYLLRQWMVPQIPVYPMQLSTNSHIYPTLFYRIQGMSGTLWNVETMPHFYREIKNSDTLERTISLLWEHRDVSVNVVSNEPRDSVASIVASLLDKDEAITAIIDQGGLFKNHRNLDVAQALLAHPNTKNFENVIYYDESQKIKVYNKVNHEIKDYNENLLDKQVTTAFWDVRHTTGSNLRVFNKTKAVVFINKATILRDVLQAVWRLRGLDILQTVGFAINKSDFAVAQSVLKGSFGNTIEMNTLKLQELLQFVIANEVNTLGKQGIRSFVYAIKTKAIEYLLGLFDGKLDRFSFAKIKKLFINKRPVKLYEAIGQPTKSISAKDFVTLEISKIMKEEYIDIIADKIGKMHQDLKVLGDAALSYLRKEFLVTLSEQFDREGELQVDVEAETHQELREEAQAEQEVTIQNVHRIVDERRVKWDEDKFFKNEYFKGLNLKPNRDLPFFLMRSFPQKELTALGFNPKIFEWDLKASYNLFHIEVTGAAFSADYEKEIGDVLVIWDQRTGPTEFILIDRDETLELGNFLIKDLENPSPLFAPSTVAFIYNVGSGIIRQNKECHLTDADVLANPHFRRLRLQAKFLGGDLFYDEEELRELEAWMKDLKREGIEPHKVKEIFLKVILKNRDYSQKNFVGSELESVFDEF